MHRIAIMQPYLFPYLGYFQLIGSVDAFWLLDDVQFIRHGWMNRNQLLTEGQVSSFTIPVTGSSHTTLIIDKTFHADCITSLKKLKKTLEQQYKNAPYRHIMIQLVEDLKYFMEARLPEPDFTDCTSFALEACCDILGIDTPIYRTSSLNLSSSMRGANRILAACKAIGATDYVNMIGGKELYSAKEFSEANIQLHFLKQSFPRYPQCGIKADKDFQPGLSILDIIANIDASQYSSHIHAGTVTAAI